MEIDTQLVIGIFIVALLIIIYLVFTNTDTNHSRSMTPTTRSKTVESFNIKTFPWKDTGNKICFLTAYIGTPEQCDINLDEKGQVPGCDYLCFTNLNDPTLLKTRSWNMIRIQDLPNFSYLKSLGNNVRISRYFKFNFIHFLSKYCQGLYNYEVIIWNDCTFYPKQTVNWSEIAEQIKSHPTGLVQYYHPSSQGNTKKMNIKHDLYLINIWSKDTKENIERTKEYLNQLDDKIDLDKPPYFENTCFGYDLKNKNASEMFSEFWRSYHKCPTYRDQPLWNFWYQKKNIRPLVKDGFKNNYHTGKRKLNLTTYTKNSAF